MGLALIIVYGPPDGLEINKLKLSVRKKASHLRSFFFGILKMNNCFLMFI